MTIILPIPHRGLSPNARYHWRAKCKLVKSAREKAFLVTKAAGRPFKPSGYSMAFFYPDARRRDDDNAEASCKAYRDGIADALRIDDHRLPKLAVSTFHVDRENPRLEITLHP